MSQYDDYPPRRPRGGRDDGGGYPPPPAYAPQDGMPSGPADHLPPPPMGDNRRPSALKREGSRSRVPQHMRPDFPDEASYLGSQAPDLERKNRRRDREFRDKRDGYESEEGDMLRKDKGGRSGRDEELDSRRRRFRDDRDANANGGSKRGKDRYDDRPPRGGAPPPRRGGSYDDRDEPPPRRRRDRDDDYDDDPKPRRRGGGAPPVEYGSEPIPAVRRRNTDAERSRQDKPRRRRDDYDDYSSDESPPRRHRSAEGRRRRDKYDDEDRHKDPDSRDQRKRRQDIYDRDRDTRRRGESRRRRYSDDDDSDYDRRDRRGGDRDRDRRDKKAPRKMEIGGYDIGPMIDKGQKHYGTLAPIVTPLIINAARKYMTNAASGKKGR